MQDDTPPDQLAPPINEGRLPLTAGVLPLTGVHAVCLMVMPVGMCFC